MQDPQNLEARGATLLGAHLAGAAIENSMLGATHSLANPLSAHFDITHGVAIGIMLPHVIRYNMEVCGHLYGELAADVGLTDANDENASELLADFVRSLVVQAGLPTCLSGCGVDVDLLGQMAVEAAAQWTANFNPRVVDNERLKELYECAISNEDSGQ